LKRFFAIIITVVSVSATRVAQQDKQESTLVSLAAPGLVRLKILHLTFCDQLPNLPRKKPLKQRDLLNQLMDI
jgi:hypothetical protein